MTTIGPSAASATPASLVTGIRSRLAPLTSETWHSPDTSRSLRGPAIHRFQSTARLTRDGGPYTHLLNPSKPDALVPPESVDHPLAGVLFAVKDLIAMQGVPLGAGSPTRAKSGPEPQDAWIVMALRARGAVPVGTTALHELAFGVTGVNAYSGFPSNPHDPDRIPGGSSSGSAVAVATGSVPLAIGTDTGGSVRIPGALCGVVGFKPSRGRFPVEGVLPLSPTLDHLGLFGTDVNTVARAHSALSGDAILSKHPRRLGVDRAALSTCDAEVADAVHSAIRRLESEGIEIVEVDLPDLQVIADVSTTIMFAEAAAIHRDLLGGQTSAFDKAVQDRIETGAEIDLQLYLDAMWHRDRLRRSLHEVLAQVDSVIGPTVPITAPTIAEATTDNALPARLVSLTRLANVTGHPALTIPLPTSGLPIGLQIMARSDSSVLATAAAAESVLDDEEPR